MRSQGKPLPPKLERWTGRYRELQLIENHKQKPSQESVLGLENLIYDWQIARSSVWASLRVRSCRSAQSSRVPTLLWLLPPGAGPVSHSKYQSKISLCFQQWGGKREPFWNTPVLSVFLNKCLSSGATNQRLTCQDFIRASQTWGR